MYIARILYPIHVLGPGKRIGIWFDGCPHHCPGCSNPELWEKQERYKISLERLMQMINAICASQEIDGFTLTGGDPFAQPEALRQLLLELEKKNPDILVYTGYEKEELQKQYPDILKHTGVLIDGKYVEERNTNVILRGSDNQNIYILKNNLADKYKVYLKTARNEIENFSMHDGVVSVGIHRPGYEKCMDQLLKKKGLKIQ